MSWRPDHPAPIVETVEMFYVEGDAYVVAAVTEIAMLRGELSGRQQG